MQRLILCACALLVGAGVLGGCEGCGETEEPALFAGSSQAPDPSAAQLEPEGGAGGQGGAGGAEPEKKKTGPLPPSWIAKCCSALQRNLPSAPDDQKGAYLGALGACQAAMKNPALIGTLRSQLPKGSPGVCL